MTPKSLSSPDAPKPPHAFSRVPPLNPSHTCSQGPVGALRCSRICLQVTCQRIPGRAQNHRESWRVQPGREMGVKASRERRQPGLQCRESRYDPSAAATKHQRPQVCTLPTPPALQAGSAPLCHCTDPGDETHQLQCPVPGGSIPLGQSGGLCLSHK